MLEILTTVRCIEFEDGEEHTLTPLAYAMGFSNQEVIKNILDVIKDKAILEEVLTTANISLKFKNGEVCPAGWKKGKPAMQASDEGVADYLNSHSAEL